MEILWWILGALAVGIGLVAVHDVVQRKHAVLRNFPVIGHFRYLLEAIGPELRQYIVTDNDEERPFSRDQRRWVYASSKRENNYFGFGTDNDPDLSSNFLIIKHASFPLNSPVPGTPDYDPEYRIPCAKVLGGFRGRKRAFRPRSVVNVSGMSFGSLGARAVEAINRGCAIAGCLHNTGEGGISTHHQHGGELVLQIGTAYFGCRDANGRFSMERLLETVNVNPQIKAIEIKMSQGAKPALGGLLPAAKITPEIAAARGIPLGVDCVSPARHTAFHDADSLLDFAESIAEATGLPVGIKSAVGETVFWENLARLSATTGRCLDLITIDGGEGGTGAGPLVFSDHVALPFKQAFTRVFAIFARHGLHEKIVFAGSAKLGFPESALLAFALGCDLVSVAREAMLSIGCIQAQRCHTGHCPTGVATHNRWLVRGLDPTLKAARLANYVLTLRKELLALSRACGVPHPGLITTGHFEVMDGQLGSATIEELFEYPLGVGLPSAADRAEIGRIMESITTADARLEEATTLA